MRPGRWAALFGEKYGEQVRVVSIGDFSMELCGEPIITSAGLAWLKWLVNPVSGLECGASRRLAQALAYLNDSERVEAGLSRLKTAPHELTEN